MTDRFELLSQLGMGGMGVVWKARDNDTGEIVALKLLHELYVNDEEYVVRLAREVEIARRIESPNVVKVLGYGEQDGIPYVAMEYVEGESLREYLHEKGKLSWVEAKALLQQIAEGLAAVHAAGVIHRDIKPSNILIAKDGTAKLADFGIARANDLTRMTSSVTMLGTPAYMAPDGEASEQGDLYGLGCVLYEMLTGAPPFAGDSQQQVWLKHLRETPDLEKLPPESRRIAGWLLEKAPVKRTPSANALIAILKGSQQSKPPPMERAKSVGVLMGVFILLPVAVIGVALAPYFVRTTQPVAAGGTTPPSIFTASLATSTLAPTATSAPTVALVTPTATVIPPAPTATLPSPTPVPPTPTRLPQIPTPVPPTSTPTPVPPAPTPTPPKSPPPKPSLTLSSGPGAPECSATTGVQMYAEFNGNATFELQARVLSPSGSEIQNWTATRTSDESTYWTICDAPSGNRYCLKFRTVDAYGTSPYSDEVCRTTEGR